MTAAASEGSYARQCGIEPHVERSASRIADGGCTRHESVRRVKHLLSDQRSVKAPTRRERSTLSEPHGVATAHGYVCGRLEPCGSRRAAAAHAEPTGLGLGLGFGLGVRLLHT